MLIGDKTYEKLYTNELNISKLYNLKPLGIGTFYTESLISYLCRLAEEHCVTVGTLINKEIIPILNKSYLHKYAEYGGNGFFDGAHTINGTQTVASDFVDVLNSLTLRSDLADLTLIKWRHVLSTKGLLRNYFSWCPICFEEWILKNKPIFVPLIWGLQAIKTCQKHGIYLKDRCPNCNTKIPLLNRKSVLGYCHKCHEWLGCKTCSSELKENSEQEERWNSWVNKNVGELIALAPYTDFAPDREVIARAIKCFIDKTTNGNTAELSRLLGIPKTTMYGWAKGKTIPPLEKQLIIGYALNISLKQIFLETDFGSVEFDFEKVSIVNERSSYLVQSRSPGGCSDRKFIKDSLKKLIHVNKLFLGLFHRLNKVSFLLPGFLHLFSPCLDLL
jgi:transcriptional regulator with XRE-family HTH domain